MSLLCLRVCFIISILLITGLSTIPNTNADSVNDETGDVFYWNGEIWEKNIEYRPNIDITSMSFEKINNEKINLILEVDGIIEESINIFYYGYLKIKDVFYKFEYSNEWGLGQILVDNEKVDESEIFSISNDKIVFTFNIFSDDTITSFDKLYAYSYKYSDNEEYWIDCAPFDYYGPGVIFVDDDSDIYGDGSVENPYCRITYAIDNAGKGDKIFVLNGIYDEYVDIFFKHNLTIEGQNKHNTIIDGNFSGDCVGFWNSNGTKIINFTIRNSGMDADHDSILAMVNLNDCRVSNIRFQNTRAYAVALSHSNDNVIENCTISSDCSNGILLQDASKYNEINDCSIESSGYGIYLWKKIENNIFKGNQIFNNRIGVFLLSENNINNEFYYNTILNNEMVGVFAYNSGNNIFYCNNFIDNGFLIRLNAFDLAGNKWYNDGFGNYWIDYNGIDADGDGIGDTPYFFFFNRDPFPRIEPYVYE